MNRRTRKAAGPSAEREHPQGEAPPPTLEDVVKIGDKKEVDPRLRPFIVAMANAIIKDMLREQKERNQ